jgi:glycine/D-amino acid oxidase-like deaminating enzyme
MVTMDATNALSPETNTVVIGAGMCGASFARHEAEAGKRVVLLDAAQIGAVMTRKSAGHVMTWFLPSPAEMSAILGPQETLRLQRWSHESKLALRHRWIDLGLS